MAIKGAKYMKYAKITTEKPDGLPTYGEAKSMGLLITANLVPRTTDAKLYADDGIAEQVTEFIDYTDTITNDDWDFDILQDILGAKSTGTGDELILNANDNPPFVGIGYIRAGIKGNKTYYEGIFLPKAKGGLPSFDAETKGESVVFKTSPIAFKGFQLENGNWFYAERFDTYELAKSYIDSKFIGTP